MIRDNRIKGLVFRINYPDYYTVNIFLSYFFKDLIKVIKSNKPLDKCSVSPEAYWVTGLLFGCKLHGPAEQNQISHVC